MAAQENKSKGIPGIGPRPKALWFPPAYRRYMRRKDMYVLTPREGALLNIPYFRVPQHSPNVSVNGSHIAVLLGLPLA